MKASLEENTNIKQMIKCMKNYVQIYFHCQMCKKKKSENQAAYRSVPSNLIDHKCHLG